MTNALKAPVAGTDPLATDVAQLANLFSALLDAGVLQLAGPQSTPAAPTAVASGSAGNLNGAYYWKTVLITGWKQGDGSYYVSGFSPSADSAQVTITSNSASLSGIATGTATVIGRAVYRTVAGGAAGTEKFAFVIWDNGTTTYTDNVADASLGTGMPTSSSSPAAYGTAIPANVPTSNTTGTSLSGYVDTVNAQTIGGAKTFSVLITADAGVAVQSGTSGLYGINGQLDIQVSADQDVYIFRSSGNDTRWNHTNGNLSLGAQLEIAPNGSTIDASLHIKKPLANGRYTQIGDATAGASIAATNIIASTNASSTEQWWAWGVGTDDTYYINPGTNLGGSTGLSVTNSGVVYVNGVAQPQLRYTNGYVEWNNGGTWQGVGGVKNVQRGSVSFAAATVWSSGNTINVTISSVNTAKAFVTFNNLFSLTSGSGNEFIINAYLTSSTNLAITIENNAGLAFSSTLYWEVVESY